MTINLIDAKSKSSVLNALDDLAVQDHLDYAALFLAANYCITDALGLSHPNYDKAQLILAEQDSASNLFVASENKKIIEEEKQLASLKKRTKWTDSGVLSVSDRLPRVDALMLAIGHSIANSGASGSYQIERA